jgi:hypothetical protein
MTQNFRVDFKRPLSRSHPIIIAEQIILNDTYALVGSIEEPVDTPSATMSIF